MDFKDKDFYELLGIPRDATKEQIKEAYVEIARIYHPDSQFYSDLVEVETNEAEQGIFKAVTHAYNTLNNDKERRKYDETLGAIGSGDGSADASKFFERTKEWHRSWRDYDDKVRTEKLRERKRTATTNNIKVTELRQQYATSGVGRESTFMAEAAKESKAKVLKIFFFFACLNIFLVLFAVIVMLLRK